MMVLTVCLALQLMKEFPPDIDTAFWTPEIVMTCFWIVIVIVTVIVIVIVTVIMIV